MDGWMDLMLQLYCFWDFPHKMVNGVKKLKYPVSSNSTGGNSVIIREVRGQCPDLTSSNK